MDILQLKTVLAEKIQPTQVSSVFNLENEVPCTLSPAIGEDGVRYIRALNERTGKVLLARFTRLEERILKERGKEETGVEFQVPANFITGIIA